MYEVNLRYLEGWNFVGTDSENFSIVLGSGDDRKGVQPTMLVLMGLGGCTAIDVVSILEKKRQKISDMQIKVTANRKDEHPKAFTDYNVHYIVMGKDVSEKAVADAIRLSEERYCGVSASLKPGAPVTTSYEIIEEE